MDGVPASSHTSLVRRTSMEIDTCNIFIFGMICLATIFSRGWRSGKPFKWLGPSYDRTDQYT